MLAGKYDNPSSWPWILSPGYEATARGHLGQHTNIDAEGYPVIDRHIEVLLQVRKEATTGLIILTMCRRLCLPLS